ncbi:MAG: hypothetical protein H0S79_24355 [Anaerolineaceae bacterium]|nr:hypothetical protein [Anaerolineaceae bacterium]
MDTEMVTNSPEKLYWYLGDGALLSLFWWGLALANDPLASAHLWPSLLIAVGGIVLATPLLVWLNNTKPRSKKNAAIGLKISIIYPLAQLGLFIWQQFDPAAANWLTLLTHPVALTINLTSSLLIGALLNRQESHLNQELAMLIWWLWQLPLIFINGSALLQYHFSNLLMFFYLATVLILAFWLAWHPKQTS